MSVSDRLSKKPNPYSGDKKPDPYGSGFLCYFLLSTAVAA